MSAVTIACPRCSGTGIYTGYGVCFRCEGARVVRAPRVSKAKAPKPLADYALIENTCGGDPTKFRTTDELARVLAYYGSSLDPAEMQAAWSAGCRQVRRVDNPSLPLYR